MAIAIKTGKDGRVPPEVMDLLIRFAEHRDLCSECTRAMKVQDRNGFCATGHSILFQLSSDPSVKEVPEDWKGDAPVK